jgi:two-component system chemotaxis response regulator CheB
VLTGARDDGKAGMGVIKDRGGIAIVQDPLEAPFPSMPLSVIQDVKVDYSVSIVEIARLLINFLMRELRRKGGIRCRIGLRLKRELRSKRWKEMNS